MRNFDGKKGKSSSLMTPSSTRHQSHQAGDVVSPRIPGCSCLLLRAKNSTKKSFLRGNVVENRGVSSHVRWFTMVWNPDM